METVLDVLPDAGVMIEPAAQARLGELFDQIVQAHHESTVARQAVAPRLTLRRRCPSGTRYRSLF